VVYNWQEQEVRNIMNPRMWLILEFGDFGIAELFLLNLKYLLEQRHHPGAFA